MGEDAQLGSEDGVTYYTYRLTAPGSRKYYIGVSHVKISEASIEDCLGDGYLGSGGTRFRNWRAKYEGRIRKEITGRYAGRDEAYAAEKELVGTLWRDDPECLNAVPGGIILNYKSAVRRRVRQGVCEIHGKTTFNGSRCYLCMAAGWIHHGNCPVHGEATFMGKTCFTCHAESKVHLAICPEHGETKHLGSACYRCLQERAITKEKCDRHGVTTHAHGRCLSCVQENALSVRECSIHGFVPHQWGKCTACTSRKSVHMGTCPVHGETKFRGEHCCKCTASRTVKMAACPVHGETAHMGQTCMKCSISGALTPGECQLHGQVALRNGTCAKCASRKNISMKECPVHGTTKHIGERCYECRRSPYYQAVCPVHGQGWHVGGKCRRCIRRGPLRKKDCVLYGKEFTPTGSGQVICRGEHPGVCPGCGATFNYRRRKTFCSARCGASWSRRNPGKKPDIRNMAIDESGD